MKSVVLDADIFIDYLKKKNNNFTLLLGAKTEKDYKLYIPTTVLVEIFVGYEFLDDNLLKSSENLLEPFEKVPLTGEIAKLAGKIGRENKIGFVGTVDLVVAATALFFKAEVATRNIKHFKQIPNLRLFDFEKLSAP